MYSLTLKPGTNGQVLTPFGRFTTWKYLISVLLLGVELGEEGWLLGLAVGEIELWGIGAIGEVEAEGLGFAATLTVHESTCFFCSELNFFAATIFLVALTPIFILRHSLVALFKLTALETFGNREKITTKIRRNAVSFFSGFFTLLKYRPWKNCNKVLSRLTYLSE